jgi:uncharacterized protein YbjT (DUF2867 family)
MEPFQESFDVVLAIGEANGRAYKTVPAGKRAVIEHASVHVTPQGAGILANYFVASTIAGNSGFKDVPIVVFCSGISVIGSHPLRAYANAGTEFGGTVRRSTTTDRLVASGVRHVIKFSGLDARPDTAFPFGLMHKEIEEYLERSGLAWTQLRPTGFMQEYLRETPSIIQDGAFYLALGDTKLNPIDLVDVAKVGFLLLRDGGHRGARLHMTGPEALAMTEIADRISRAVGKTCGTSQYLQSSADRR